MKKIYLLAFVCGLTSPALQAQDINFSSEYNKVVWPTKLGVGGGLIGDDGNYKRLSLFHGHSISLQTGSNTPNIEKSRMSIDASGNVGIGTASRINRLDVRGGYTSVDYLQVNPQDNAYEGGEIQLKGAANNPTWQMDVYGTAFRLHSNGSDNLFVTNELLSVQGGMGIGTRNIGSYKLAVEGKIGAREIDVKVGSWADFVFQPGYRLRPLSEVAHFIDQHQHLPEIPSETDVKASGISLGDMNAKLLQKIEELTLYVIEQQKQIDQLKLHLPKTEKAP